jgi:uncharacterized protein
MSFLKTRGGAVLVLIAVIVLSTMYGVNRSLGNEVVPQSEEHYVADYAGVLAEATKEGIIRTNALLEEKTGGQIVVVTVEYLDGMYSDEYAVKLFNDWGVGDKDKDNGMLLLLAVNEGKAWLTQGAGIANAFSDDIINSYLDSYFWREFDNGNFDTAVRNLFDPLVWWYEDYYNTAIISDPSEIGSAPDYGQGSTAEYPAGDGPRYGYEDGYEEYSALDGFIGFIIVLIVAYIIYAVFFRPMRRRRYYGGDVYVHRPWFFFPFFWFGGRHWHHGPGPGPGGQAQIPAADAGAALAGEAAEAAVSVDAEASAAGSAEASAVDSADAVPGEAADADNRKKLKWGLAGAQ